MDRFRNCLFQIEQEFAETYLLCGSVEGGVTASMKTRSNVLVVKFTSNFMNSARGFNLSYEAIESKYTR